MPIRLSAEQRSDFLESIRRFFDEDLDLEIGELKADFVLRYVLEEIAPTIYNQAVQDASRWFRTRVDDLEGSCFEPEREYWKRRDAG